MVALAAAQPCALGGEQNPFCSTDATMASDEASCETEQPVPQGIAQGLHLGTGGMPRARKEGSSVQGRQGHLNSLHKQRG